MMYPKENEPFIVGILAVRAHSNCIAVTQNGFGFSLSFFLGTPLKIFTYIFKMINNPSFWACKLFWK